MKSLYLDFLPFPAIFRLQSSLFATMALIKLTVISDPVCPWVCYNPPMASYIHLNLNFHTQCYIGYRRLTKAIRLYQKTYPGGSQDRIRISWKPYFLDREAPMESVPYIGL